MTNCPNCGVNLDNAPKIGFLNYKPGHGVSLCEKCISKPDGLDENRIMRKLGRNWSSADIISIRRAIRELKERKNNCEVKP
jgi:hypothetical protein